MGKKRILLIILLIAAIIIISFIILFNNKIKINNKTVADQKMDIDNNFISEDEVYKLIDKIPVIYRKGYNGAYTNSHTTEKDIYEVILLFSLKSIPNKNNINDKENTEKIILDLANNMNIKLTKKNKVILYKNEDIINILKKNYNTTYKINNLSKMRLVESTLYRYNDYSLLVYDEDYSDQQNTIVPINFQYIVEKKGDNIFLYEKILFIELDNNNYNIYKSIDDINLGNNKIELLKILGKDKKFNNDYNAESIERIQLKKKSTVYLHIFVNREGDYYWDLSTVSKI